MGEALLSLSFMDLTVVFHSVLSLSPSLSGFVLLSPCSAL